VTEFCMSVDTQDVITRATFCDEWLRGLGVARGRISRFPIDLRRRPYNTLALPCECVIIKDQSMSSQATVRLNTHNLLLVIHGRTCHFVPVARYRPTEILRCKSFRLHLSLTRR